jgi:amino acid adenylation domain-containing protein
MEETIFPTSFSQRRLWFIQTMSPRNTAYNLVFTLELGFLPDLEGVQEALAALVTRHETLRTSFSFEDGEPIQVISSSGELPLASHDLRNWPADKQSEFARRVSASLAEPFDLSRLPLLRPHLGIFSDHHSRLALVVHHIIADAHSIRVLSEDLQTAYQAFVSGRVAVLPELPVQYADYAVWQRQILSGTRLERLTKYWTKRLEGLSDLELFQDKPRPPAGTFLGALHPFVIPASVVMRLRNLSGTSGNTLFATLLAGFSALLGRFTGQTSFAIGTPVTGRPKPELDHLVGLFINSLVFRIDLSEDPTFQDLVKRTSLFLADDLTHQEFPFELLVEALDPKRRADRNPLFQVMFQLQTAEPNSRPATDEVPSEGIEQLESGAVTSQFDLSIIQHETATGNIEGAAVFAQELFEEHTIAQLIDAYLLILNKASLKPLTRISELPVLNDERRTKILSLSAGKQDAITVDLLHQWFDRRAKSTPDNVAFKFNDIELTFAQLNGRSNALAASFQELGLGPRQVAAICLPRTEHLITAILGVLKAGGAYVCLDPSAPTERLRFIVADCDATVVLTQRDWAGIEGGRQVLFLDEAAEISESREAPVVGTSPSHPAYVIYTSGSTGQPKGVAISHQAIVNHMLWMLNEFPIGPGDRVLQRTPLTFDASVWEVFAPLLSGATLVFQPEQELFDPVQLVAVIKRDEISTLQVVPSLLRALLQSGLGGCPTLKFVFCGGEELSAELRDAFFQQSQAQLCNLYGPSETTIDATFHVCGRNDKRPFVPIGRPISNVTARVLDDSRALLPVGVAGELYIGGAAVGIGYLNQRALTSERFVDDPFVEGARLYRTGDRARMLESGELQFLGRLDDQVKLRGFRVEPGEIENALRLHPAVRETAVVVQQHGPNDQRLIAFVVPVSNRNGDLSFELLDWLREGLPHYLVPSRVEIMSALPITAHGKLDRQSLSLRRVVNESMREVRVEPRNALERDICHCFEELLNIGEVGIDDDFFHLGGHSLLIISLQHKLLPILGHEVNVVTLIEFPTPRRLARELMSHDATKQDAHALTFSGSKGS